MSASAKLHEVELYSKVAASFRMILKIISKDFVKLLTIKTNGKTRRFDRASVFNKGMVK